VQVERVCWDLDNIVGAQCSFAVGVAQYANAELAYVISGAP
jgi:hypothetical protein